MIKLYEEFINESEKKIFTNGSELDIQPNDKVSFTIGYENTKINAIVKSIEEDHILVIDDNNKKYKITNIKLSKLKKNIIFIKMIKLYEEFINEQKEIITTVDKFWTWYTGDKKWWKDDDFLNTTSIDNEHAQDDSKYSMNLFISNKNEKISIKSNKTKQGDYDLGFMLDRKIVLVQSINPAMSIDESRKFLNGTPILPCDKLNLKTGKCNGNGFIFDMNKKNDSFIEVWEDTNKKYRLIINLGTNKYTNLEFDSFYNESNSRFIFNGNYIDGVIANEYSKLLKYGNFLPLYLYA